MNRSPIVNCPLDVSGLDYHSSRWSFENIGSQNYIPRPFQQWILYVFIWFKFPLLVNL